MSGICDYIGMSTQKRACVFPPVSHQPPTIKGDGVRYRFGP
jgi:hypothetical protein